MDGTRDPPTGSKQVSAWWLLTLEDQKLHPQIKLRDFIYEPAETCKLSHPCAGSELPYLFPITFPHDPHAPHTWGSLVSLFLITYVPESFGCREGDMRSAPIFLLQFSHSVMSDSLWPHGRQHARPPCPSPTPRACSNSCPSSQGCHPTISSSVVPFSSCLQSFPESGSFPMSQFFASGGQSVGASTSASVLPMNIQGWFPLGLTGLILLQSKGLSRVFSNTLVFSNSSKASVLQHSAFFIAQLSHPYMTTGETTALTIQTFVSKGMSLLFNMLSRFVIALLPRSTHLLISSSCLESCKQTPSLLQTWASRVLISCGSANMA